MGIYKELRSKLGQEVAAAKAGISVRSARRLDSTEVLPSQREARTWRTRTDPFDAVWQSELVPMLEAAPALTANQPFSGWDQVFPEPAMTLAAVDRLVHHSTIFELNVESYRRRAATTGVTTLQPKKR